jgi:RNA polymerase sigma-70 factor (ECF subfamily)
MIGFLGGDFELAEEAVADAFAIAAARWPADGTPANPGGWLLKTARNRAIDRIRRERTLDVKYRLLAPSLSESSGDGADANLEEDEMTIPDERLELVFTCCHPALSLEAQVALTLRALGGLQTEEIARAFLVAPETMKRRLTRAKAKIKTAGIPFTVPADHLLPDRLAAVLAVVYLIFNEAYSAAPARPELASEALRLAMLLAELMPDEPEVLGLLALILIHDSRREARFSDGEVVLLADQDRTLWDEHQIERGRALIDRALVLRGTGPYMLQAAIASLQAEPELDWPQVAALYQRLAGLTGSPVVECNRAVAVAHAVGDEAGLAILDRLADGGELADYQYLHSTRGELLRRLGRASEARAAYARAIELCDADGPQRRYLMRRLDGL